MTRSPGAEAGRRAIRARLVALGPRMAMPVERNDLARELVTRVISGEWAWDRLVTLEQRVLTSPGADESLVKALALRGMKKTRALDDVFDGLCCGDATVDEGARELVRLANQTVRMLLAELDRELNGRFHRTESLHNEDDSDLTEGVQERIFREQAILEKIQLDVTDGRDKAILLDYRAALEVAVHSARRARRLDHAFEAIAPLLNRFLDLLVNARRIDRQQRQLVIAKFKRQWNWRRPAAWLLRVTGTKPADIGKLLHVKQGHARVLIHRFKRGAGGDLGFIG